MLVSPTLVSVVVELVDCVPLDAELASVVVETDVELVLLDVLVATELVPVDDVAAVLLDAALALLALVLDAPVELAVVVTEDVPVPPVLLVPPLLVIPLVAAELSVEIDVVSSAVLDVLPHPANASALARAINGPRRPRSDGERKEGAIVRPPERRAEECMCETRSGQTSAGQGSAGMGKL